MHFPMHREKMAGENLREGGMEVASELWTEQVRRRASVGFNGVSAVKRKAISDEEINPVSAKCRVNL